ncbi:MAG: agmatinase [Rhodobacteraceae bacterium]|nr:agmatinase [Paracoccaceae bacterium]
MSDDHRLLTDAAFRREGLYGSRVEPTFSGVLSFMRRRYGRDLTGVDIAVTGLPFDQAVSNRPGARFGPEAIRKASAHHSWGPVWPWGFDPFDTLAVVDYGDCTIDYGDVAGVPAAIEAHVAGILAGGAQTLCLGGDHFTTYPVLRAHAARHGPLALVHFDAHRDFEADAGRRIDHGSMFTRALDEGLVDPARSIQIGIRTTFAGEGGGGVRVIDAEETHALGPGPIAAAIRATAGDGPAYLTFDIDFLDPSTAPGTGTPVPGGMTSFQALSILRALRGFDPVGMDVVEVSPPWDHAEMTSNAAAMVALEMLCLKAWARGARAAPEAGRGGGPGGGAGGGGAGPRRP